MTRSTVLVLGDARTSVFRHERFRADHPSTTLSICSVGDKLRAGDGPDARVKVYRIFRDAVTAVPHDRVVVMLSADLDPEEPVELAIRRHREFLAELERERRRVIVVGAPGADSEPALEFDRAIAAYCAEHGITFLAPDPAASHPDEFAGLLSDRLRTLI